MTMRHPVVDRAARKAVFPAWAGPAERLRFLLRYAVMAPSRHNAQPWLFEIEGSELRVYGDGRRALKVADPQGRELAMACGAALYNVQVAARHFGYATSTEITATARNDGLLARFTLEDRRAPTPDEELLFDTIPKRRTHPFALADAREVPLHVVAGLVREVAAEGAVLRVVDRAARGRVASLVAEGDKIQWSSARFRAELAAWSRSTSRAASDGVCSSAPSLSDSASLLHRMLVRLHVRGDDHRREQLAALRSRALFALCTREDSPAEWFAAGQAMQRALLRAAAAGLCATYFGPAVEVAPVRAKLRAALAERGFPQILFRLGYGVPARASPRRPVELVLRSMTAAPSRDLVRPGEFDLEVETEVEIDQPAFLSGRAAARM